MHLAGCCKCGTMHLCRYDTCATTLNSEGHSICNITSLCIKMLNFSDHEYVDTVLVKPRNTSTPKKSPRQSRKKRLKNLSLQKCTQRGRQVLTGDDEKIENNVSVIVKEFLCSEEWVYSNKVEYDRYVYKWSISFTKVLKDFKKTRPGHLPIIPDMYIQNLQSMGNTRVPSDADVHQRKVLSARCSENIRHHIMMMKHRFPEIIGNNRIRGTVVGLLYLMRHGIIVKGVVVLPRLQILHDMLPLETHLPHIFKIKGKVITETENIVKQVLKGLSPNELGVYGTPQNMNPFSRVELGSTKSCQ
jgi:hypothetical protein